MTDDDKLRHFAKQWVEGARAFKRYYEQPAMRGLQRWAQSIRDAEFEADAAETTSSETPTPATPMPAPQREARQANSGCPELPLDDESIREVLRGINKEFEDRLGYWPSGRDAWPIVHQRFRARVKKDYFLGIASEKEFQEKRRGPADH